jgi:hypothetical protein
VTHGIDLGKLSHAEKDDLILSLLPLVGQLERHWHGSPNWSSDWPCSNGRRRTPTIRHCRRRRVRSAIARPATSLSAGAVQASVARSNQTPTAWLMQGLKSAPIAPPASPPSSRRPAGRLATRERHCGTRAPESPTAASQRSGGSSHPCHARVAQRAFPISADADTSNGVATNRADSKPPRRRCVSRTARRTHPKTATAAGA